MGKFMSLEELIKKQIVYGEISPGAKINISKLKNQFNVGLAPLREALARLVNTGLLLSEPNKGYKVAPISKEEFWDLCEASRHLEILALKQAIQRGDALWEEEIIASLFQLKKLEEGGKAPNFDEWKVAHVRFHDALISSCSAILKEMRSLIHLRSERYVQIAFKKVDLSFFHEDHKELAEAALARDIPRATGVMKKHSERATKIHIEERSE